MGGMFRRPVIQTIASQVPVAAPAPTPTPVAALPTVDDETVRQNRQLNQQQALQRGGRRSTILTSPESRGGDSYSAQRFG